MARVWGLRPGGSAVGGPWTGGDQQQLLVPPAALPRLLGEGGPSAALRQTGPWSLQPGEQLFAATAAALRELATGEVVGEVPSPFAAEAAVVAEASVAAEAAMETSWLRYIDSQLRELATGEVVGEVPSPFAAEAAVVAEASVAAEAAMETFWLRYIDSQLRELATGEVVGEVPSPFAAEAAAVAEAAAAAEAAMETEAAVAAKAVTVQQALCQLRPQQAAAGEGREVAEVAGGGSCSHQQWEASLGRSSPAGGTTKVMMAPLPGGCSGARRAQQQRQQAANGEDFCWESSLLLPRPLAAGEQDAAAQGRDPTHPGSGAKQATHIAVNRAGGRGGDGEAINHQSSGGDDRTAAAASPGGSRGANSCTAGGGRDRGPAGDAVKQENTAVGHLIVYREHGGRLVGLAAVLSLVFPSAVQAAASDVQARPSVTLHRREDGKESLVEYTLTLRRKKPRSKYLRLSPAKELITSMALRTGDNLRLFLLPDGRALVEKGDRWHADRRLPPDLVQLTEATMERCSPVLYIPLRVINPLLGETTAAAAPAGLKIRVRAVGDDRKAASLRKCPNRQWKLCGLQQWLRSSNAAAGDFLRLRLVHSRAAGTTTGPAAAASVAAAAAGGSGQSSSGGSSPHGHIIDPEAITIIVRLERASTGPGRPLGSAAGPPPPSTHAPPRAPATTSSRDERWIRGPSAASAAVGHTSAMPTAGSSSSRVAAASWESPYTAACQTLWQARWRMGQQDMAAAAAHGTEPVLGSGGLHDDAAAAMVVDEHQERAAVAWPAEGEGSGGLETIELLDSSTDEGEEDLEDMEDMEDMEDVEGPAVNSNLPQRTEVKSSYPSVLLADLPTGPTQLPVPAGLAPAPVQPPLMQASLVASWSQPPVPAALPTGPTQLPVPAGLAPAPAQQPLMQTSLIASWSQPPAPAAPGTGPGWPTVPAAGLAPGIVQQPLMQTSLIASWSQPPAPAAPGTGPGWPTVPAAGLAPGIVQQPLMQASLIASWSQPPAPAAPGTGPGWPTVPAAGLAPGIVQQPLMQTSLIASWSQPPVPAALATGPGWLKVPAAGLAPAPVQPPLMQASLIASWSQPPAPAAPGTGPGWPTVPPAALKTAGANRPTVPTDLGTGPVVWPTVRALGAAGPVQAPLSAAFAAGPYHQPSVPAALGAAGTVVSSADVLPPASCLRHLHGCVPQEVGLPPLQPGEVRLCGVTFAASLDMGRRMSQWQQQASVEASHQQPLAAGLPYPTQLWMEGAEGRGAEGPSTTPYHGLSPDVVCWHLAQRLGLTSYNTCGAPLPEGPLEPEGFEPRPELSRGGKGMFATRPIQRNDVICVMGGYVMPQQPDGVAFLERGQHFLQPHVKQQLRQRLIGSSSSGEAVVVNEALPWAFLATSFRMDWAVGGQQQGQRQQQQQRQQPQVFQEQAHAIAAAGLPPLELQMLGYGNQSAFINDPRVEPWRPHGVAADNAAAANCMVVTVWVRGAPLPVLVALRDIQPDEQLLRDYGDSWWREQSSWWGMLKYFGLAPETVLHGTPPSSRGWMND
ncbi:hypothetical protein PLESTB_000221900 [Pleodorina starrii]|uniref:SET domain-containing protein n=1 Tax=Pleodorina starrii TaxID=330485 RepID=A0A9W6BC63_9CHLO|nr:hypothetical protein PLESTB_000221900 [Pleodorina starrii]